MATQLFSFLKETSEEAKTIVFSDSRQDAARAALNIESLHHQDLRRLLLVKSISEALDNKKEEFANKSELEQQYEVAITEKNYQLIVELAPKLARLSENSLPKRVSLSEMIEIKDDLKVSPFLIKYFVIIVN